MDYPQKCILKFLVYARTLGMINEYRSDGILLVLLLQKKEDLMDYFQDLKILL